MLKRTEGSKIGTAKGAGAQVWAQGLFGKPPEITPQEKIVRALVNEHIPSIYKCFVELEENPIPTTVLVDHIAARFEFSAESQKILHAAAQIASEENPNPYHNPMHFQHVFILAALLGRRASYMSNLDEQNFRNLLVAALIHDYKHDGTGNKGEQFRLEKISIAASRERLLAAGLTPEDLEVISGYVLATDISKDFSNPDAKSPIETLRDYQKTKKAWYIQPELRSLYKRSQRDGINHMEVAMILHDADVGASIITAGMCEELGHRLAEEQHKPFNTNDSKFFLVNIVHKEMASQIGFDLLQPYLNDTLRAYDIPLEEPAVNL